MSLMLDPNQIELLRRIDRLPEKDRAELLRRVEAKQSEDRKIWYCQRGRTCDGKPHEGAPYKHARSDQWPPPGKDWDTWFYMSGRGVGKTRAGGNWVRMMSRYTGRIALIGRRGTDVRATMVEGPSGLIEACIAAGESYDWKPALKEFTFENGAKAFGYSAEEPESLRGPEHGAGWLDEPCHMDLIDEVWSNYGLGLRSEGVPGGAKTLLTSSPLPTKWTKDRIKEEYTVLVSVPTSVNIDNLDESYKRRIIDPLKGTRKGKQELDAMLLEDVEGALWMATWMQRETFRREDMDRMVVAWDPAGSDKKTSDLQGIIAAGRYGERYGVFEDATDSLSPLSAARRVISLYDKYEADAIVLERYGGDSATTILRQAGFKGKIKEVKARVGKKTRAEPISGLYEQKLVDHLTGAELAELEDQQLTWVPAVAKDSPDRIDALVWALTDLSGGKSGTVQMGVPRGSLSPSTATNYRGPGARPTTRGWNRR